MNNTIFALFLFTISSLSVSAMRPDQTLAKDVAKEFNELIHREFSSTKGGIEEQPLGTFLQPNEFDDQVFWFDALPRLARLQSPEVIRLNQFLQESDFLRRIGQIKIQRLLHTPSLPKPLRLLKNFLQKQSGENTSYAPEAVFSLLVTNNNIKNSLFDRIALGIILSKNTHKSESVYTNNEWFFRPNDDVSEIFEQLLVVDKEIELDLKQLNIAWKLAEKDLVKARTLIEEKRLGPWLFRDQLLQKKITGRDIKEIAFSINYSWITQKERIAALQKIDPTPLNLMLLYAFYVNNNEAKRSSLSPITYIWHRNILPFYDIEYCSPHIELLGPIAHQVLENLGFNKDVEINPNAQGGQKSKTSKKKAKKKAAKPSLKNQPKGTSKKGEQLIEPSIERVDELVLEVDGDENQDSLVEELNAFVDQSQQLKAAHWAKGKASKLHSTHQGKYFELERTKGHRALDMLAFLIRNRLYEHSKTRTGTVSLTLVNDQGFDKLVISTKYDVFAPAIIEVMENLIKPELHKQYGGTHKALLIEEQDLQQIVHTSILNAKERFSASNKVLKKRAELYTRRLAQIIAAPGDALEARIAEVLSQKNSAIEIIANPFHMHAEMRLVSYLLEHKLALDVLRNGKDVLPYQYLGCSMLNCAMCDGLLRGSKEIRGINEDARKNSMVFFSKGFYAVAYPGYFVPSWGAKINRLEYGKVTQNLLLLGPSANTVDPFALFTMQNGELTDSDDESPDENE